MKALFTGLLALGVAGSAWIAEAISASSNDDRRAPAAAAAGGPEVLNEQRVFEAALGAVSSCVVKIETIGGAAPVRKDPRGEQVRRTGFQQADGPTTGVIWSADGYIVTSAFNFIRDPSVITVTLHDGRKLLAKLLARDRPAMLALLKVEAEGLSAAKWVDPAQLRPGQRALAAGFGFGSERPSLSIGIVSALRRMGGIAVQSDVRISPAQYGGPLFDLDGRVIGICVPLSTSGDELAGVEYYDSGIAFAVHRDRVAAQLERMKSGKDIARGVMGVRVEPASTGLRLIASPVGPAAEAGLAEADIITAVDSEPVRTILELRRILSFKAAGDRVLVRHRRGESEQTAEVVLVRPDDLPPPTTQPASGPATAPSAIPVP